MANDFRDQPSLAELRLAQVQVNCARAVSLLPEFVSPKLRIRSSLGVAKLLLALFYV